MLTWASVAILSLFEIELLTLLAASGLRDFFSNVYYVLDIVIVSASLVLECVFYNTAGLSDLIGLVMFLRLWRLLRIGLAPRCGVHLIPFSFMPSRARRCTHDLRILATDTPCLRAPSGPARPTI